MASSLHFLEGVRAAGAGPLPWIETHRKAPYFVTESGETWTPIGQNDSIAWPELRGLYKRRDRGSAERYLEMLRGHGVTCLRLMLEYSQGLRHSFEKPAGRPRPEIVALWDDLFALCEQYGLRILLTPFDTFWMWMKWKQHPYNAKNGGPCADKRRMLLCPAARAAMKARLAFAIDRWSGSGALFAWDLWNEIHPSYAEDSAAGFDEFITDIGGFVRAREMARYGRAHPQTVSVFGPHMLLDRNIPETIFRHPGLDFATTHFYEEGTIDHPKNTVDAAVSVGRLMRQALSELRDHRPFFDSEHGPIHTFKDHRRMLPEAFDDEYFRHIQWAHLCAGGSGGGMRWPNRSPHSLTPGMRQAQRALADFLPAIDWSVFARRNWNEEVRVSRPEVKVVACGDAKQALIWLLRTDKRDRRRLLKQDIPPIAVTVEMPELVGGAYRVMAWDTRAGKIAHEHDVLTPGPGLSVEVPGLISGLALAVRRM